MAKDDDAVAGVIPLDDPAAIPPDEGDVGLGGSTRRRLSRSAG
jgi:hypothetical protein